MQNNSAHTIDIMQRKIDSLYTRRKHLCFYLDVAAAFNIIFFGILAYQLIFLQLPVLIATVILILKPSLAKDLLPQQYVGITGMILTSMKSIALICYTFKYMISSILSIKNADLSQSVGELFKQKQRNSLYPSMPAGGADDSDTVLVAIMCALLGLIIFFEIISLQFSIRITVKSFKMVNVIKEVDLLFVRVAPDSPLNDGRNGGEEEQAAPIRVRIDQIVPLTHSQAITFSTVELHQALRNRGI